MSNRERINSRKKEGSEEPRQKKSPPLRKMETDRTTQHHDYSSKSKKPFLTGSSHSSITKFQKEDEDLHIKKEFKSYFFKNNQENPNKHSIPLLKPKKPPQRTPIRHSNQSYKQIENKRESSRKRALSKEDLGKRIKDITSNSLSSSTHTHTLSHKHSLQNTLKLSTHTNLPPSHKHPSLDSEMETLKHEIDTLDKKVLLNQKTNQIIASIQNNQHVYQIQTHTPLKILKRNMAQRSKSNGKSGQYKESGTYLLKIKTEKFLQKCARLKNQSVQKEREGEREESNQKEFGYSLQNTGAVGRSYDFKSDQSPESQSQKESEPSVSPFSPFDRNGEGESQGVNEQNEGSFEQSVRKSQRMESEKKKEPETKHESKNKILDKTKEPAQELEQEKEKSEEQQAKQKEGEKEWIQSHRFGDENIVQCGNSSETLKHKLLSTRDLKNEEIGENTMNFKDAMELNLEDVNPLRSENMKEALNSFTKKYEEEEEERFKHIQKEVNILKQTVHSLNSTNQELVNKLDCLKDSKSQEFALFQEEKVIN